MTPSTVARKILVRLTWNVVALVVSLPAIGLGLFFIAQAAPLVAWVIGAGLGFAAYRLGVWPAVALSALIIFGSVVPNHPNECSTDPSCDGSASEAWPNHPGFVIVFAALIGGGVVAGTVRDLKRPRPSPS